MSDAKLERLWSHCGFDCEVKIMPVGHRCGYVFVDKSHPLYGVDENELPKDFKPYVNGGITYSGDRNRDDRWAFGFDFGHYWNIPDEACNRHKMDCYPGLTREVLDTVNIRLDPAARVATLDMAIEDCEKLAECLYAWKDKPYVYTLNYWNYYSKREPDEIMCNGVRYVKARWNEIRAY